MLRNNMIKVIRKRVGKVNTVTAAPARPHLPLHKTSRRTITPLSRVSLGGRFVRELALAVAALPGGVLVVHVLDVVLQVAFGRRRVHAADVWAAVCARTLTSRSARSRGYVVWNAIRKRVEADLGCLRLGGKRLSP